MAWLVGMAAATASSILILIVLFMVKESWPALEHIGPYRFISDGSWHPTDNDFGMMPMFFSSLFVSTGAVVIAVPLGIAYALIYRLYAPPWIARPYRWAIILFSGIPSVVLGLWGLTIVVPLIGSIQPPGTSLLTGMLILAIMILPTIALTAEAALAAVPPSYWSGCHALGLSREGMLLRVILPAARGGIAAGILLATARALGETMVVLMVTGNVVRMPDSLFAPVRTLTANIGLEMAYAMTEHRSALFVSGLALTLLVLMLSVGAARFASGRRHA
ncbi:MAG: phosphate ABC transporter permease subunit PstC [Rhodospirillales bacterium]